MQTNEMINEITSFNINYLDTAIELYTYDLYLCLITSVEIDVSAPLCCPRNDDWKSQPEVTRGKPEM